MNCSPVFWQMWFRPVFQTGGSAVDSWSCAANCPSSPSLGLMLITPEKATESNYNFLVLGVEFAQWLQDKHQSKSLRWIRKAICYFPFHVLAVHCAPYSFSSAMAKPNSCKSPRVPGQLLCSATSVLPHLRALHLTFHIFVLFVLDYFPREGINWEAIDWMDNAECLDLIEKVSSNLWQFPGITAGTADCLETFPGVSCFENR